MREEFERWCLQVVRGNPNNLTRDESGGYKYLAAMYLGWEAATLIEREKCVAVCRALAEEARATKQYVRADHYSVCESHIRKRSNGAIQGPRSGPAGMEGSTT